MVLGLEFLFISVSHFTSFTVPFSLSPVAFALYSLHKLLSDGYETNRIENDPQQLG